MNTLTQEQVAQIIGATGHIIGQRTHKRANGGAIEIVTTLTALCNGKLFEHQEEFTLCRACYDIDRAEMAGHCGPLGLTHKNRNLECITVGRPGEVWCGQPREVWYWYSVTSKGLNLKATGHVVTAQVMYRTDGNVIDRVTTLTALCDTNLPEQCGESRFDGFLFEIHHGALVGISLCTACILRWERILRNE